MNINVATQNTGLLAWTGSAARPIDIRRHNNFGFTFEVIADIPPADVIFEVEAAPPSDADPCVPGAFADVEETLLCMASWGAVPAPSTQIVIPGGTKAGSKCTATLPCRPAAFVQLKSVSGLVANVIAVAVLGGPR